MHRRLISKFRKIALIYLLNTSITVCKEISLAVGLIVHLTLGSYKA